MSESSRTADRASLFWTLLPHLVFAVLFVATFKRWVLPFEDSGREMNTALRLAEGEALYRDVGYSYGPLPPLVDGLLLRAFGRSLDVLVAWRTILALLGVEALRRLTRRLAPEESLAAAVSAFAIAACAFGVGGSWPFPYSVAALTGTVGAWWALELALASRSPAGSIAAGVVAGLAAGTKLEMVPLALTGPLLVLALRRPRKESLWAGAWMAGAAGTAYALPIVLFGETLMRRQGFLIALSVPESFRRLYQGLLFGGLTPADFVRGGFRDVLFPSAIGVAFVFLLPAGGRTFELVLLPLLFAAGALTFFSAGNEWLHVLLPLAGCVAIAGLVRAGDRVAARAPFAGRRGRWSRPRHAPRAHAPALLSSKPGLRRVLGSSRARGRALLDRPAHARAKRVRRSRSRPLDGPDRAASSGNRHGRDDADGVFRARRCPSFRRSRAS